MALRSKKYNNKNVQREFQAAGDKDAFVLADGSEPQSLDDVLKILEDRYAAQMMRQVGLISNDKEKKKQNPSSASLPKLRVARPSLDNLLSLAAAADKVGSASERGSEGVHAEKGKKSRKTKDSKKSGGNSTSFPLAANASQAAADVHLNAAFSNSVPASAVDPPSADVSVARMSPLLLNAAPGLPEAVPVLRSIPEYEAQPAQLQAQASVESFAAAAADFAAPSFGSETAADFFDSIHLQADKAGGLGQGLGGSAHDSIPLSQAAKELEALGSTTLAHAPQASATATTYATAEADMMYGLQHQHAQHAGYVDYDGSYSSASATAAAGTYDLFMSYPYPHGSPLL